MSSYGYQSDHVNLIANNLQDRYKSGFPILKELIQNADDAKARRLVFGLHPGFKGEASHPLLQGQGLWIFNDGQFKKEDERAIRSFGLNTKAGESGSIGKFGLGMKSVFHLCEAFFYVAFDGNKYFDVLLNPWHDPDGEDLFHKAWGYVEVQEFEALRRLVVAEKLNKDCDSWFLMWIPLRRRDHVPQKDGKPYGGIIDKYPGDAGSNEVLDLFDGGLSRKIRSVVPLLRNLELIEFASFGSNPGFKVQISFDEGSQRVDHRSAELVSTGSVSDGGASKGKLRFRIQQKAMPGELPFSQFQMLDVWPKTGHLNSDGIREPVPDKSEAEGAVLVSGAPADGDVAKLDIHWAVFLPMEDGFNYEFPLEKSQQQYRIVLHGQFFVDAGRRGIAGFGHLAETSLEPSPDLDDADLHTGWNQAVAQKVILPQLLPTLAQFADGLNESEKEELARAILRARTKASSNGISKGFWESFRDFVCNDQAWLRLITRDGLKWSHVHTTKDSRLLFLPSPPRLAIERPWKVLPRLQNLINEGCFLIDEAAPSLMRTHNNWDQQTLIDVLDSVDLKEACSDTGMEYLTRFLSLENRRYVGGSDIQRKLVSLLRTMLKQESLQTFRSFRSTFQALVSLVKPDFRMAIGTKGVGALSGLDDVTLKLLIGADTERAVLPKDLDPLDGDASKGVPDDDEIRSLLKVIDQEVSKLVGSDSSDSLKRVDSLLRAAQSVLALLDDKKDERGQAVRVNKSLRILTATCARNDKGMPVSLEELQLANKKGLLFKLQGIGTGTYSIAAELAILLPNEQIWVVGADIAGWVFQRANANSSVVPSATDPAAAYVALGKRGQPLALAEKNIRRQFVKKVFPPLINGAEIVRGLRYVLHGSALNHDDTESSLWISEGQADEVWVKLKVMVEPDSWNVIDSNLAGEVKRNDWDTLGILKVGPDEVIGHMAEGFDPGAIDVGQFSAKEISSILGRISDEKLWKSIPLHRDTNGKFGPITDNCFLDPKAIAPLSVISDVRVITTNEDSKVLDKQIEWIPSWSDLTTIERVLSSSGETFDWEIILNAIGNVESQSLYKIANLRTVRWLPLSNGGAISPEDVVDFDELVADIDRLAAQCGYCYAGILAIASEMQNHPNFPKLKPLFSSGKSGLEKLGQLMVEAGDQLVGDVALPDKYLDLIDFLAGLTSLPGWGIVKDAIDAVGVDRAVDVADCLIKEIQQPLSVDKLVTVLNEISQQNGKRQNHVFNLYLKQLADNSTETLSAALRQIRLQARDGRWMSANLLCASVEGVAKSSVLNSEQAQILERYIASVISSHSSNDGLDGLPTDGDESVSSQSKAKALAAMTDYFKPWRELMPSGPIGAFFALLGPTFRESAVEWLKPHSYDHFADQLGWNEPGERSSPVWDYKRREHPKLEALDMLEFMPQISSDKQIKVVSLLGDDISVPVDSEFDGLVVGNLIWSGKRGGKSLFQMRLRTVSQPEQYEKSMLSDLLRRTCECILREAYNQRGSNLGQIWELLAKSDQFELAVARELILNRLPYELRNLRAVKKNQELINWQNAFKKLEGSKAEKAEAKQATDLVEKEISSAKIVLSVLMTNDAKVQAAVLSGIRERVRHNKYEVSSIAFEILQNADDAVSELQTLMRDDSAVVHPSVHVGRFVMETKGDTVRFLHWGRPVNYMGHGKSRNESYGEDLQRMLTLAASDKDETSGLTGKFGLGFKSVLLATDAPCLLSGDLKTKILGGCLPTQWSDASGAVDSLQRHKLPEAPGLRGTVVEFKVNGVDSQSAILNRFAALAGFQSVFCKEIRAIKINDEFHQWSPKALAESLPCVETGMIQMPSKGGHSRSMLMNFRVGGSCFALKVGSRGFVRFSDDCIHAPPGVWVTAPTREPAANGLILNGQFELDTGRGGLPHGDSARSNLSMAKRLGSNAADLVLKATSKSKSDWEGMRSNLKLAKDVCSSEFWASFWAQIPLKKLDHDSAESSHLLAEFGFGLFGRYIDSAGELPNGLSGAHSSFVDSASVCLALSSRWEKHFETLSGWMELVDKFPICGWVSEAVAVQLRGSSKASDIKIAELSIEFILELVPNNRCSADVMDKLCLLFGDVSELESMAVKAAIVKFDFQAKDGNWKAGRNLLKSTVQFDNQCLPFAPTSSVLDPSYLGDGLNLIQEHAPYEIADPLAIAGWILDSPPEPHAARVAGLRFLLGNQSVQNLVRVKMFGSWIAALTSTSPYLVNFSIQEKNQLLGMFNPNPTWEEEEVEEAEACESDGAEALRAIYIWWEQNSVKQLEKFDRSFWPASIPRKFDSASEDRGSWMTLLALGLMQRHGRVRDHQNRGFIDMMQNRGFWEVFCSKDPRENEKTWFEVLDDYGTKQVEDEQYSLWMDNFPRLYRIARRLDVYIHLFQGLDYRDPSQVSGYLSPSADPEMSGSGIHAPTLGTSLKLGQHVVVRELLRAGALSGKTAKSLAYKPGSSLRGFLAGIGFRDLADSEVTSQQIYSVLTECIGGDATFDNAFDIPLLILARDPALQQEILGRTVTNLESSYGE